METTVSVQSGGQRAGGKSGCQYMPGRSLSDDTHASACISCSIKFGQGNWTVFICMSYTS